MTLAEVIARVLKYISDNDLGCYTCAGICGIDVNEDTIEVCFTDGNTEDWVIPIKDTESQASNGRKK